MSNKRWLTQDERPLEVGDFVLANTNAANYTSRHVGVVVDARFLAAIDGSRIPLVTITKYKFVNFG